MWAHQRDQHVSWQHVDSLQIPRIKRSTFMTPGCDLFQHYFDAKNPEVRKITINAGAMQVEHERKRRVNLVIW